MRARHVSFILHRNKIVSYGVNALKTDPFALEYYKYPFIHSEAKAIKDFPHQKYDITKCRLVNLRIGREDNTLLKCSPCPSCTKLITATGLKEVICL